MATFGKFGTFRILGAWMDTNPSISALKVEGKQNASQWVKKDENDQDDVDVDDNDDNDDNNICATSPDGWWWLGC